MNDDPLAAFQALLEMQQGGPRGGVMPANAFSGLPAESSYEKLLANPFSQVARSGGPATLNMGEVDLGIRDGSQHGFAPEVDFSDVINAAQDEEPAAAEATPALGVTDEELAHLNDFASQGLHTQNALRQGNIDTSVPGHSAEAMEIFSRLSPAQMVRLGWATGSGGGARGASGGADGGPGGGTAGGPDPGPSGGGHSGRHAGGPVDDRDMVPGEELPGQVPLLEGEFVVTREAVDLFGADFFEQLNAMAKQQKGQNLNTPQGPVPVTGSPGAHLPNPGAPPPGAMPPGAAPPGPAAPPPTDAAMMAFRNQIGL